MEKKHLREWRKLKGYTTKYVAKYLGLSVYSLNAKERGDYDFTMAQKQALCSLYGVDIEQTLDK